MSMKIVQVSEVLPIMARGCWKALIVPTFPYLGSLGYHKLLSTKFPYGDRKRYG